MARTHDPQQPPQRHLHLVPPVPPLVTPLPAVVPLLRPNSPVSPTDDELLTTIAQQARLGDRQARLLLWRAFAPKLEPARYRCGRMTYQPDWARRNGRPWELEDLRQEAWLVFTDLIESWNGEGSIVPYVTAYFPWRLRQAMRRLGPVRRGAPLFLAATMTAECDGLLDAEDEALLAAIAADLSPLDGAILHLRLMDDLSFSTIARRLGLTRRTVHRHWIRIRNRARDVLAARPAKSTRERSADGLD